MKSPQQNQWSGRPLRRTEESRVHRESTMLNGTIGGGTDQKNNPYCYEPVEEAWLDSWMKRE